MAARGLAPPCPLCSANRTSPRFQHGPYTIFGCGACGGGFSWPRLRSDQLDSVYGPAYADSYTSGVMSREQFARCRFGQIAAALRAYAPGCVDCEGKRLLDVGCATGRFAAEFLRIGWRADGVELSPRLADEARANGLTVHVGEFPGLELPGGSYDLVTIFHVIEHFDSAPEAMAECFRLLRPGGLLVLETPNWRGIGALVRGSRWSHIIPPEHLNYFGPASLSSLLVRAGFSGVRTRTVTPQVIEVTARAPGWVQRVVRAGYQLATLCGIGATLQAFASKRPSPAPGDRGTAP